MFYWSSLIISVLAWGIAEIFYKAGSLSKEKYSHLKIAVLVGVFMGLYSTGMLIYLLATGVTFNPLNILIYLPVALLYIVSMICSYFGVRFIAESIADPIENTGCALVPILAAIFLHETLGLMPIVAIILIVIGILCVGFFDKNGKETRTTKLGKKLAIFAFAMPFCYAILDGIGTFLDDEIIEDYLVSIDGLSDINICNVTNCCYEFTFFIISMGILVFLKIKGEKIFSLGDQQKEECEALNLDSENLTFMNKVYLQRNKIFAAIFETIGQATYLYALDAKNSVSAVLLGAGTVIISLLLSRLFLKEKITLLQYAFLLIILAGIIILCF